MKNVGYTVRLYWNYIDSRKVLKNWTFAARNDAWHQFYCVETVSLDLVASHDMISRDFLSEKQFNPVGNCVVDCVIGLIIYLWSLFYEIPSTDDVSRWCIKVFTKAISLRVFSMITTGSFDGHLRKLGANTMERLEASILVTLTTSWAVKSCRNLIR